MKRLILGLAILVAIAVSSSGCTRDNLPSVNIPCLASCAVQAATCAMSCGGTSSSSCSSSGDVDP